MKAADINNLFGDMDIFLLDLILKGHIPLEGRVLDIGCGEGRNGIYFIQNGYEYHGWDTDHSKLKLLEYLTRSLASHDAHFQAVDIMDGENKHGFDIIICSRLLHFAESVDQLFAWWKKLNTLLRKGGIIYVSMDSAVDNTLAKVVGNGKVEFPDTKIRLGLTAHLYDEMKKGFEEVEPLRTLAHHNERAQSFLILRKV